VHNGIESLAVEAVPVVIHEVPNSVEFAVGSAAIKRRQMRAIGGEAFDGIKPVGFG